MSVFSQIVSNMVEWHLVQPLTVTKVEPVANDFCFLRVQADSSGRRGAQ